MNIVKLAAAGDGKTYRICKEVIDFARKETRKLVLLITYTNRGFEAIISTLKSQNYGIVPSNVIVLTWYKFLLRELIKPYQTYIYGLNQIKSIDYTLEHKKQFFSKWDRKTISNAC